MATPNFSHLHRPKPSLTVMMALVSLIVFVYYGFWLSIFHAEKVHDITEHLEHAKASIESNVGIRVMAFTQRLEFRYAYPFRLLTSDATRQTWLAGVIAQDISADLYAAIRIHGRDTTVTASQGCFAMGEAINCLPSHQRPMVQHVVSRHGVTYTVWIELSRFLSSPMDTFQFSHDPYKKGRTMVVTSGAFFQIDTEFSFRAIKLYHAGWIEAHGTRLYFFLPQPFLKWRLIEYVVLLALMNGVVAVIYAYDNRYKRSFLLLKAILSDAPELFWLKGVDGKYLLINRIAALKLFNRQPEAVVGSYDAELFGPYERAFVESCRQSDMAVVQANDFKTHAGMEFGVIRGELMSLDVAKRLFRDVDGSVFGIIGTARDMSDETALNAALLQKQGILDALVNRLDAFIYAKDREHRFTMVNRALCAFHDRPEAWFLGKTDYDLHPESASEQYLADEQSVFETGEDYVADETLFLPDGTTRIMRVTKLPIFDGRGQITGLVGMNLDVTHIAGRVEELGVVLDLLTKRIRKKTRTSTERVAHGHEAE